MLKGSLTTKAGNAGFNPAGGKAVKNATKLFILLAATMVARQAAADQCVEVRSGDTLKSLKRRANLNIPNAQIVDSNLGMTWGVVKFSDADSNSHRKHFAMDKVGASAQLKFYASRWGKRRGWTMTNTKFGLRHDRGPNACVALAIPANPCLAPMAQCTESVRVIQASKGVAPAQPSAPSAQVAALQTELERARRDASDLTAEREAVIRERNKAKDELAQMTAGFERLSAQAIPAINKAAAERDKLAEQIETVRLERDALHRDLEKERAKVAEPSSATAVQETAQKRTADSGQQAEQERRTSEERRSREREENLRNALAMGERVTGLLEQAKACHEKDGTRYDFERRDCVMISSMVTQPLSGWPMWVLGIGVALVLSLVAHAQRRERRGQRGMEKFNLAFLQMRDALQALCGVEGNGHTQVVNGGEPTPERFDAIMRRIRAEAGRFKRMTEDATSRLRIALASLEPDDDKRAELIAQYEGHEIDDLVTKTAEVMATQTREIEELRAAQPAEHATQPVEAVEAVAEVTDDGALLAQMAELQRAHDALEQERDTARQDVERLADNLAKARKEIACLTTERDGADAEAKQLRRRLELRSGAVVGQEAARRITAEIESALQQMQQSADMRAAAARRGHVEQGVATLRRVTQELLAVVTPAAS